MAPESSDDEDFWLDCLNSIQKDRTIKTRGHPFNELDELSFQEKCRLNKATVLRLLEEIEDKLEYTLNTNNSVSPINQLLMTLRFYATGTFQLLIGETFGVHKSTASRIIWKVTKELAGLSTKYIKFPCTPEEQEDTMLKFYNSTGFPEVVGAIDCTHVAISSPGGPTAEIYRNRKGYFSINVQLITDPDLYFTDVVARWPGSTHDSTIYNFCHKRALFEGGTVQRGYLIGDSGYACTQHMLTPLATPVNSAESAYNNCHVQTRNCVERSIGVLKRRFPALKYGLRIKTARVPVLIVAAAILHNIARIMGEDEPPDDFELHQYLELKRRQGIQVDFDEVEALPPVVTTNQPGAMGVRRALILGHFT